MALDVLLGPQNIDILVAPLCRLDRRKAAGVSGRLDVGAILTLN